MGDSIIESVSKAVGPRPPILDLNTGSVTEPETDTNTDTDTGPHPSSESDSSRGPRDKQGRTFNPAIHAVQKDGSPSVTKSGFLRAKRGASGQTYVPPQAIAGDEAVAAAGKAISRSFVTICIMLGGTEWNPSQDEMVGLDMAWSEYFKARGIEEIPPEVVLGTVLMGYMGPRLAASQTFRARVSGWLSRFRRNGGNAQFNSGNNGQREN